jgi:tetratricopeptide (TPR) repeat protein
MIRVLALAAAFGLLLAGCNKGGKTGAVVQNDAPARMQSALKLAAQAEDAWKAGKTDEALELYQRSLEESQDLPLVWNNVGTLLMRKDNYMDAAEAFKRAADLSPKDPVPYYNVGLMYQRRGYPALEWFVKSLERDPRYLPSLRAAVVSAKRQVIADDAALNRVRTALLLETDPQWRSIMMTEQIRIENDLKGKPGL